MFHYSDSSQRQKNEAGELCMEHKLIASINKSSYNVSHSSKFWQIYKNHETRSFIFGSAFFMKLILDPLSELSFHINIHYNSCVHNDCFVDQEKGGIFVWHEVEGKYLAVA